MCGRTMEEKRLEGKREQSGTRSIDRTGYFLSRIDVRERTGGREREKKRTSRKASKSVLLLVVFLFFFGKKTDA